MAQQVILSTTLDDETLLCPMIDARRMEVYSAIYNNKLETVRDIAADIVEEDTYKVYLDKYKVLFFGDGADKCKDVINHPNAVFLDNIYPSAKYMQRLSEQTFLDNDFVDVAYFEPFYLKDFVTTVSKKNLF